MAKKDAQTDLIPNRNDDGIGGAELQEAVRLIKAAILQSQSKAAQMVNQEQLSLYFGIGRYVSENSRQGFWGMSAIDNISKLLKAELPGLRGFSAENIKLMRRFYEAWKDLEVNPVVETTEMENSDLRALSTNSVVETTELQKPVTKPLTIRGLRLTHDEDFPRTS